MVTGGVWSCTLRWLCAWRVGLWSSGPRDRWWDSLISSADVRGQLRQERAEENGWGGGANPVGGPRRCSERVLQPRVAAGFISPIESLIVMSRFKSASTG